MLSGITLEHLAKWTQGSWAVAPKASGPVRVISTDSRSIQPGEVFVALKGEVFDGNEFVEAVARQGAAAAIVERKSECPLPQLLVPDANKALEYVPDDLLARMVLAEAHLATGKREVAAEEFKRVLELRPKDKRALAGLAAATAPPPKKGKPAPKKKR